MFDPLSIKSNSGNYRVNFTENVFDEVKNLISDSTHFLLDSNVAQLYSKDLRETLKSKKTITIEAKEVNKSIEKVVGTINNIVQNEIRRDHRIIAIGGGIIQDICCFIASTLLRGVEWNFIPTTLLSQADSCIGSKSSINLGTTKNILGTFNPPKEIWISSSFLRTLKKEEIHSGIGEILKVHIIESQTKFNELKQEFESIYCNRKYLEKYIRQSLIIKKKYIEEDEFDKGIRNIFNYGHTFGHAIESATKFAMPHGIAVSLGMDLANHVSVMRGDLDAKICHNMHEALIKNYKDYLNIKFSLDDMIVAMKKDKKNTSDKISLILPKGENAKIEKVEVSPDSIFKDQCKSFLGSLNT